MQSQQLLTESQVFEDEILPGTESAEPPNRGDAGATRSWQESYRNSPNRDFRQVIHFVGVRCFGETQAILLRVTGLDTLDANTETQPPNGELA